LTLDKDRLQKLYIEQNLSINKIAVITNKSHKYISSKVKEFSLSKSKDYLNYKWLHHHYIELNMTTTEIAAIAGVTDPTIASALRNNSIVKDSAILQKSRVEKMKKSNLVRFGSESAFSSEEVKEKIKETMIERYGAANPRNVEELNNKAIETCLGKYGVEHPMKNLKIKESVIQTKIENGSIKVLENGKTINEMCLDSGISPASIYKISDGLSDKDIISATENFKAKHTALENIFSSRSGLKPYNYLFDASKYPLLRYRPDFKLDNRTAINVDGLYWHSEKNKDKRYHYKMRADYEGLDNLRIIQFREDEVLNKFDIIQSMINNVLGKNKRIFARKTKLDNVPRDVYSWFFETNHLMGSVNARTFGLFHDGELVSAMSYRVYKDKIKIERFCSKNNTTVVGGAGKMLYAIQNLHGLPIHYWADLRYGTGNYLKALGFEKQRDTLGWKWTDGANTFNRLSCRANMDPRCLSEREYAEEKGWYKIYDAGQRLWVKD